MRLAGSHQLVLRAALTPYSKKATCHNPTHHPPRRATLRLSAAGPMELSVVLCDDPYIQGLNAEWRGKDAPTDVLSFEMAEDELEDLPEVG